MRKPKRFIQHAIKRPGRIKRAAAREGVSTRVEAERFAHSSDPSKRGAGKLGLRFMKGGDLHRSGKRKRKRSGGRQ